MALLRSACHFLSPLASVPRLSQRVLFTMSAGGSSKKAASDA
ncbi:MAG: hypothetical protein K0R39_4234 [Symbiobacteriaceae bacterium]|jgi:hypothetical protein|nr:hypothetical protein [Symbiobacteriaceae bacterium]